MNLEAQIAELQSQHRVALKQTAQAALYMQDLHRVSDSAEDHVHVRIRAAQNEAGRRFLKSFNMLPREIRDGSESLLALLVDEMQDQTDLRNIIIAERIRFQKVSKAANMAKAARRRKQMFALSN